MIQAQWVQAQWSKWHHTSTGTESQSQYDYNSAELQKMKSWKS